MKILVLGAGAIGGYYGSQLAKVGCEVSLVCRTNSEYIQKNGLQIQSPFTHDFHFKPHAVYVDSAEALENHYDYILVSLKVLPEIDVIAMLLPIVKDNSSIVLLQNGIDIESVVAERFPNNPLISGLCFICVSRVGKNTIDHQDYGRITIGNYPFGIDEQTEKLGKLFQQSGVECLITENIQESRWKKLIWNAPFNPISVLGGGVTTKEMLSDPTSVAFIRRVMQEVIILANAEGYSLDSSVIEENLRDTEKMKPYKSSMLLDYEAKRPMEVEAILGNVLKIAKKHRIEVPYLSGLYALLSLADQQSHH